MASHKLYKVTRTVVVHDTDQTGDIIHIADMVVGGCREQEVCEFARVHMPALEAQYEARELTDDEYTAYYAGEISNETQIKH